MGDNISGLKCGLKCVWDPRCCWAPDPSSPFSLGSLGPFYPWFQQRKVQVHRAQAPPALAALHLADLGWIQSSSPSVSPQLLDPSPWFPGGHWFQFLKMPNIISYHSFCAAPASNIPAPGWGCLMFTFACRLSHHLSVNLCYLLTQVWALGFWKPNYLSALKGQLKFIRNFIWLKPLCLLLEKWNTNSHKFLCFRWVNVTHRITGFLFLTRFKWNRLFI